MVKFDNIVYVGDKVETKFGIRQITKMELMPEPRHYSKCGINVNKIFIVCGKNSFLSISLSIKKQLKKTG